MSDHVADLRPLSNAPADLWPSLRQAFQAAAYVDRVLDEAEEIAAGKPEPVRAPLVRWGLLEKRRPDATLAALFVYGADVERSLVEQALGASLAARLLDAGMLRAEGDQLSAAFRVTPFDGVWIVSDELWRAGDPAMGPSLTTDMLRRTLPPLDGLDFLDVGCGAGSLAIWAAARGARSAVGVDISPRAIELSRLSALLTGVTCEWLVGDLTAPVAGRRFDVIASQPPFLVHPPEVGAATFLHGGATGVELPFRLLSELEGVLTPTGRALVLFDAPVGDAPLARRVMAAVEPRAPMGVVLSIGGYLEPDAVAWLTAAGQSRWADADYARRAAQYREHLATAAIVRVAHVLADLRRLPPGAAAFAATVTWSRLAGLPAALLESAWRSVGLLGLSPDALLTARLRVADGARLRVEQPLSGDGPPAFTLAFAGGFVQEQALDEQSVAVLRALAERGTVAAACEDLAEPGTARQLHAPVLDLVRRLLLQGVLVDSR